MHFSHEPRSHVIAISGREVLALAVRELPYLESIDVSGLVALNVGQQNSLNFSTTAAVVACMTAKAEQVSKGDSAASSRPLALTVRWTWTADLVQRERDYAEKKVGEIMSVHEGRKIEEVKAAWAALPSSAQSMIKLEAKKGAKKFFAEFKAWPEFKDEIMETLTDLEEEDLDEY